MKTAAKKTKKTAKPLGVRHSDFREDEEYHVELTVAKAHSRILEVMEKLDISKADLAKKLGCTRAHVSNLLDEDRNLTVRTLGKIMFNLGCEVDFNAFDVGAKREFVPYHSSKPVVVNVEPIEVKLNMDYMKVHTVPEKVGYRDVKIMWTNVDYSLSNSTAMAVKVLPRDKMPTKHYTLEDLIDD